MKTNRACRACKRPFAADRRNRRQQRYCSEPECQRERRRRAQRERRNRSNRRPGNSSPDGKHTRFPAHLTLSEAVNITEDPFVVGLISHLTDTTDLEEVRWTIRRLIERGHQIMPRPRSPPILRRHPRRALAAKMRKSGGFFCSLFRGINERFDNIKEFFLSRARQFRQGGED